MHKQADSSSAPARLALGALVLLLAAVASRWRESDAPLLFFSTPVVEGFRIHVTDARGVTNTTPEQLLIWGVSTVLAKPPPVRLPPVDGYLCQVEMADAGGKAVARTAFGKAIGKNFHDLDKPSRSIVLRSKLSLGTPTNLDEYPHLFNLFRAKDVFKIEKPGAYTLRLRFQILVFSGPRGQMKPHAVRFPPLDVPLVEGPIPE